MNLRASLCCLLFIPACFNPDDSDLTGGDTEMMASSSGLATTNPSTSGPSTSGSTTTSGTSVGPGSTTENTTIADDSTSSTSSTSSTGETGETSSSTGDPAGECGNGEAEPNEFCFDGFDIVPIGCPATDLAVGDLDGNDHLDIIYAAAPDSEIGVYLGSGMGSFIFGTQEALGGGVSRIAMGDFDGMSGPDLAMLDSSGDLGTYLNDGNGTVQPSVDVVENTSGNGLATGDLDGDGLSDIVVVGSGQFGFWTALAADGVSPFSATTISGTGNHFRRAAVITELNGNGNADIVVVSDFGLHACLGNGSGDVVNCNTTAIGSDPTDVVAADFDGDGNVDVAAIDPMDSELSILLGQGNGGFETPVVVPATGAARRLETADFNNDGYADLAYVVPNPPEAVIQLWDPEMGVFGPPNAFSSKAPNFSDLAAGDFNEDGIPDLAIGSSGQATISLLLSDA